MTTVIDTFASRPRQPHHVGKPSTRALRKPEWLRVKAPLSFAYTKTRETLRAHKLTTVCEEAACPNIGECWNQAHATFMIMGEICTRACAFCNVTTGIPNPLDADEPRRIADAVRALALRHVVVTSVDRDDLDDGGAGHFVATINAIRTTAPDVSIEILTPDFLRKNNVLKDIVNAKPDVFNHNLETVPRLYPTIRPGARYFHSLRLLQSVKETDPQIFTKSGIMLGLGESRTEILQVMDDMRSADIDFITLGQYLQPTLRHAPIDRFVPPEEFDALATIARAKGFLMVAASPLTRSSHHADADFKNYKTPPQNEANAAPPPKPL